MSYILDALRKADAERVRGVVPGLHAQPTMADPMDAGSSKLNHRLWWAVGILSVLVIGLLAWAMFGRDTPPERHPPEPGDAQVSGVQPNTPSTPNTDNRPEQAPNSMASARVSTPLTPPVQAPAPAPADTYPPVQTPVAPLGQATAPGQDRPIADKAAALATPSSATKPSAAGPATQHAASSNDNPIYPFNELPESVRRDIPHLTVGGAMYSDTPASRLLIINGQVFHEGDKLNAELTLEEIRLKSAILKFRQYRYAVTY